MHAINGYAANGLNGERGGNSGSSASHLSLIFFFGWAHETVMVFFARYIAVPSRNDTHVQ